MNEVKSLVKDAKMLLLEEHFNEHVEDLLWRLRQMEHKTMDEIAKAMSVNGVTISVEEVATWLGYLDMESVVPLYLTKPDPNKAPPPAPLKKAASPVDLMNDPSRTTGGMCDDKCIHADSCKFYERYYGRKCYVDIHTKREFLSPVNSYIARTYSRDQDLQKIFQGFADQMANIHQIMQRKVRHLNRQGVTVIERKIDPNTGKMVENEIPNPLGDDILRDSKQVMAMMKELGFTPKSARSEDAGESDPSSLTKVIQLEERRRLETEHITAVKQQRYQERGQIQSKEQLLSAINEKMRFDATMSRVLAGEDDSSATPENSNALVPVEQPATARRPDATADATGKVLDRPKHDVDIPDEVQSILNRLHKNGGK